MGPKGNASSDNQRALFWVIIIFSAVILIGYFLFSRGGGAPRGSSLIPAGERTEAASWEVESIGAGSPAGSASLRGKVVILHFWASWCPPCRSEFPEFVKWTENNRGDAGLAVIPVSLDRGKEAGKAFFKKHTESMDCYYDSGKVAGDFGIQGIPATIILDREGRVAFSTEGAAEWTDRAIGGIIEDLVREGN